MRGKDNKKKILMNKAERNELSYEGREQKNKNKLDLISYSKKNEMKILIIIKTDELEQNKKKFYSKKVCYSNFEAFFSCFFGYNFFN